MHISNFILNYTILYYFLHFLIITQLNLKCKLFYLKVCSKNKASKLGPIRY